MRLLPGEMDLKILKEVLPDIVFEPLDEVDLLPKYVKCNWTLTYKKTYVYLELSYPDVIHTLLCTWKLTCANCGSFFKKINNEKMSSHWSSTGHTTWKELSLFFCFYNMAVFVHIVFVLTPKNLHIFWAMRGSIEENLTKKGKHYLTILYK